MDILSSDHSLGMVDVVFTIFLIDIHIQMPILFWGQCSQTPWKFLFPIVQKVLGGTKMWSFELLIQKGQLSEEAQLVWTLSSEAGRFASSGWAFFCLKAMAWAFVSNLWPQMTLQSVEDSGLTFPFLGRPTAPWKLIHFPPLLVKVRPITERKMTQRKKPRSLSASNPNPKYLLCLPHSPDRHNYKEYTFCL